MTHASRRRSESGAVAVVVAISSLVLFGFAAIAVDLGNGFVRARDVQYQADFAALAGGSELPTTGTKSASDPAVKLVRDYLNSNQPQDDGAGSCVSTQSCVTADELVDGDDANGEVYYSANGNQLRVVAPWAKVDFGLAGALGASGTRVSAEATVELRSPGRLLPFFLPKNCVVGPISLKDNTGGSPGNVNLTFDPASSNGGTLPRPNTATGTSANGAAPPNVASDVTLAGRNFTTSMEADFFLESTNDRVPADTSAGVSIDAAKITLSGRNNVDDTAVVTLPPGVYNRPGYWQVRLKSSAGWSSHFARLHVDAPPVGGTGCGVAATGDFGMLDNPRVTAPSMTQMDRWAVNIADGIDHSLQLFDGTLPPEGADSCNGLGSTPYSGAILDKLPISDDPNCVSVQTGFQPNPVTQGFITGITTNGDPYDGLLDGPTLDGCDRTGGSSTKNRIGVFTNDDVLSCFLPEDGSVTVGDVYGATIPPTAEHSISSRIFESPRFAVVPVIDYPANPQNGFYPVIKYQPIFITDETQNSKHGESFATSANGLVIHDNGQGQKLLEVQIIPINPDALPESADSSVAGTIPWIGSGTRIIAMVD